MWDHSFDGELAGRASVARRLCAWAVFVTDHQALPFPWLRFRFPLCAFLFQPQYFTKTILLAFSPLKSFPKYLPALEKGNSSPLPSSPGQPSNLACFLGHRETNGLKWESREPFVPGNERGWKSTFFANTFLWWWRPLKDKLSSKLFLSSPLAWSFGSGELWVRLFTATGERKMISFSNSHFLLGSLSSYYATNLTRCQSRTSAVRQTPPLLTGAEEECASQVPSLGLRWAAQGPDFCTCF